MTPRATSELDHCRNGQFPRARMRFECAIYVEGGCPLHQSGAAAPRWRMLNRSDPEVTMLRSQWLDDHGQPAPEFNAARRLDRAVAEMLGLARGILADGVVAPEEAEALAQWIRANPDTAGVWPVDVIAHRLNRIFADGRVDPAEQWELKDLLEQLVGGKFGIIAGSNVATSLPLTQPPPELRFPGWTYVLTGRFAFGPRAACERAMEELGAICESTVTRRTRVLVIGTFGSRDWVHTSFGRKIEKAVAYRERGLPIAIVSEDHWAAALP